MCELRFPIFCELVDENLNHASPNHAKDLVIIPEIMRHGQVV